MFKSPSHMPGAKKGQICFNRLVASPRQHNSAKVITNADHNYGTSSFGRQAGSILSLEISFEKSGCTHRALFPYQPQTTIGQLATFLKKEVQEQHVYFSTSDLNLDYLLSLPQRKVKELEVKRLEVSINMIKIKRGPQLNNFEILNCVGTGGFSRVYLVRGYGRLMALKAIDKQFIVDNEKQNIVESQRQILQKCSGHPFITRLYLSFQTNHYLIFCMEYCNGGELFNLLRKVRRMKEEQAKFYFLETLAAISHLHNEKILYRDLKPQNIIIDSEGHVRLADYGLSKIMKDEMTHSFCGSAEYMAPEMLKKKGHSFQIDYYCLGALLYQLLFGLPPYYSRNQAQLFNNILQKDLQFPSGVQVSKQLKKFLHRMLQKDRDLRFKNVAEIMKHPWMKGVNMDDVLAKKMDPPFKTSMFEKNFDSADFQKDEEKEILKLERQQQREALQPEQVEFKDFYYIDKQLQELQASLQKDNGQRYNFSKKNTQISQPVSTIDSQKSLIRNNTMKSIDNSNLYQDYQSNYHQQYSPRVNPTSQLANSRSGEKLKMFISQASKLSPGHYGPSHGQSNNSSNGSTFGQSYSSSQGPSQLIPQFSQFRQGKPSQILNGSRDSSKVNSSGNASKLVEVRSVPLINQKHQFINSSPVNERVNSPININNYINIYTNKSPNKGPQISFTAPGFSGTSHLKKQSNNLQSSSHSGFANYSYDKNIINSSYKNNHNSYGITNSIERAKFSSLDKPPNYGNSSHTFLKNNYYHQPSVPAGRAYLSHFRDRNNPNPQKIKKSFKTGERSSFNFMSPTVPLRRY